MIPYLSSGQGRQHPERRVTGQQDEGGLSVEDTQEDSHFFGDPLTYKPDHLFRIFLLNIGGLSKSQNNYKNQALKQILINNKVDVCCLTETNVHWKLLPPEERLNSRFQYWFENLHVHGSYFASYPYADWHQVGGTSLLSINEASTRVMGHGSDQPLGRWSWTRYRGKDGLTLRVFAAYRPTLNTGGLNTAYSQQTWYYQTQNQTHCPRRTMIEDLCTDIAQARIQGDQIIVAIDANEDLRQGLVKTQLSNQELTEINLHHHGSHTSGTYNRGSAPIDGIWVSSTLLGGRCGYLPHGEGPPGCDHCILWLDLPKASVFGNKLVSSKPSARRLKCQDPRTVQRFQEHYVEKLMAQELLERCSALHSQAQTGVWTDTMALEWESIDQIRMDYIAQADRHCRKLKMGNVDWSPAVAKTMKTILAWSLLRRRLTTARVNGRYVRRILHQVGISWDALDYPWEQVQLYYQQAVKAYYDLKPLASQKRASHLESLAAAIAEQSLPSSTQETQASDHPINPATTAKILKQLKLQEQQRKNARIIKFANGKLSGHSGLPMVIAPGPTPGSRVPCYTKPEIEKAIFEENIRRFWQASETPFLQPPLCAKVGPMGTGPGAEEILASGTIALTPEDSPLPIGVSKYLQQLKRDDNVVELSLQDAQITMAKHKSAWGVAKETTSSGDPLLHFGHCKACALQPYLCEFEAKMRNIPFITGYSPQRWQRVVNVELLKQPDNFNVEKLRTIMLMEAAWNNNNKIIGRELMWHAERQNLLAPEQYGSRKLRAASTQALNKKLVFDLFRQQRITGAIGSNDAKSCYDRIVHSVAMLSMRRMGYPVEPLISMFSTLQQLRQYIRTSAGDSDTYYDGSHTDIPMQGVGQGNGASPAIWAVVSTPILKLLRIEDLGVFFQAAIDNEEVKLVGFAFVDDTDLATSARGSHDGTSEEEVTARMQKSFDTWISGLHATGGAVNADKSHWTLIAFHWDSEGNFSYKTVRDTPADIWVTDFDGQRKKLRRLEATKGDRMLGVRLSADGLDNEEVEFRKQQAKEWSDRLRTGHLPRHLAWQSLNTTIMPQLEYPLPATTFSRQQCSDIMTPVLQTGLSNSGIVRTISQAIVYGPLKYQGLGIHDLYVTQGIAHIEKLINHAYSTRDPTGQLLRASAQHLLLELGTGSKLFDHDFRILGTVATRSWMTHTWQFFSEFGINLESTLPTLALQCPADQFLMDAFQSHYRKGLAKLNRCRMYLNVCTLAEITTADGKYITKAAWNGEKATVPTNHCCWPTQHRPTQYIWQLFQAALVSAFGVNPITRELPQPLTEWDLKVPCQYYYCSTEQRVYSRQQGHWQVHIRASTRSTRTAHREFTRTPSSTTSVLPPSAQKITVQLTTSKIWITGISSRYHNSPTSNIPTNPPGTTFLSYLSGQPSSVTWAWDEFYCEGRPQDLLQAIQQGTGRVVSDGSYKVTSHGIPYGTSSWIFYVSESLWMRGSNSIPGDTSSQSSYRSELGGLFGLVYVTTALVQFFLKEEAHSFTGVVPIGCDGESALDQCFSPGKGITATHSDYDLIIAIRRQLFQYPNLEWKPHHIEGHQDDHQRVEDLDLWAQLNVKCDTWAKARWKSCTEDSDQSLLPPQIVIQNAPWAIRIGGSLVSKHLKATLREHCSGEVLKNYWVKRHRFRQQPASSIDWDSSHRALRSMNQGQRREFTKHHSGNQATNKNMKRRKQRDTEACPRCNAPVEDSSHIIQCPQEAATALWDQSIQQVKTWLLKSKTDPDIAYTIISRLQSWRSSSAPATFGSISSTIQDLLNKQDAIGWEAAFRGCWSCGWAEAQDQHFKSLQSKKSGRRWLAALITKLWQVAWDMWEHRNGILTDQEQGQLAQLLKREIQQEYSRGFQSLPSDLRRSTQIPMEQLLERSLKQQQTWLGRIQDGRNFGEAEEQQARRQVRAQQRFMANWSASAQQS